MNEDLDKFIDLIEKHFNEIDLKKCDWNVKTKQQAIKEIKEYDYMAGWIITEVMSWGTPIDYFKEIRVENDNNDCIIKVNNKYFGHNYKNPNYFYEVFPKVVVIEKLIFEGLS